MKQIFTLLDKTNFINDCNDTQNLFKLLSRDSFLKKESVNINENIDSIKFFDVSHSNNYFSTSSWKRSKAFLFFKKSKTSNITINNNFLFLSQKHNESFQNFFNFLFITKKLLGSFSIEANVKGGGISSQMHALNLAFYKFLHFFSKKKVLNLNNFNNFFHKTKKKERKKFGLKKARKGFQYSKR